VSDHGSSSGTSPQLNVTSHAADGVDQVDPSSSITVCPSAVAGQESHPPSGTVTDQEPQSSLTLFTMVDLSLLHHWTLSTSLSISESKTFDTYWQLVFPRMALDHPHVMHGILSVAALHLAHLHTESSEKYLVTAAQHHNVALRGFQDAVGKLNDHNSDALFACSNLNVLYVLRNSVERYNICNSSKDSTNRRSQALGAEWIPMIRGVEAVLASVYERVLQGPLKAMLDVGNWDDIDPDTSSSAEEMHLREVCELWSGAGGDPVYDGALCFLRKCCVYVHQFSGPGCERSGPEENRRVWSGYLFWFHYAPEEYFLRLQQRQPVALVLFAYFGAIFYEARDFWFVGDCGRNIVKVVDELLGDYWKSALKWPKEIVGLD
jgi:hypothetical protein